MKTVVFSFFVTLVAALNMVPESRAQYIYPVLSYHVSSKFGARRDPINGMWRFHNGVDIAAPKGAEVRAIDSGRVVYAGLWAGHGWHVTILHDGEVTSHYSHCDLLEVSLGERVRAGQVIAQVGATGHARGSHLHLEIRERGVPRDPTNFLTALKKQAQG